MVAVPKDVETRLDEYCAAHDRVVTELIGYGVDGFVWRTDSVHVLKTSISIVKVHRHVKEFQQELVAYQRLSEKKIERLQGFWIPLLLNYDGDRLILELSFVSPPFVLDFGAAPLGAPPPGFNPDDAAWQAEKQRLFGADWPDVKRLLDALRQYGIHFSDVHLGNIRVRP